MKITSQMSNEPGTSPTQERIPLLPKPMNCPSKCDEWEQRVASENPGCEHSMSNVELKEWLDILRPSRISIAQREARGGKKKGVSDEVEI
jgi:hypothetical protein